MHTRSGLLCGAAVLGALFLSENHYICTRTHVFHVSQHIFNEMSLICYQIEEPPINPISWTLQNFGGYPRSKWSSHSLPMTDLVRTSRPKTPDQPSLFLSLYGTQEVSSTKQVASNITARNLAEPCANDFLNPFAFPTNTEISKMGPQMQGPHCFRDKKKLSTCSIWNASSEMIFGKQLQFRCSGHRDRANPHMKC